MIFFDLDDTLMDHAGAESKALEAFVQEIGFTFDLQWENFQSRWILASQKYMQLYLTGALGFQEQRRRRLVDALNANLSDEYTDTLFQKYSVAYERNWTAFPDVFPALEELRSLGLGIITNGSPDQQNRKIDTLGLRQYFSTIIISGDVGISKPDPGIFQLACRHAGVECEDTCYVGDRFESDAVASKRAGFGRGVYLDRLGEGEAADESVTIISDLGQLRRVVAA